MGGESDINPSFNFEFGSSEGPVQAPWEFGGALKQAHKEQGQAKQTTIDHKIQKQLAARGKKQQQNGRGRAQARRSEDADSNNSESEDDSDAPLPGEIDDDSDGNEQRAMQPAARSKRKQPEQQHQEQQRRQRQAQHHQQQAQQQSETGQQQQQQGKDQGRAGSGDASDSDSDAEEGAAELVQQAKRRKAAGGAPSRSNDGGFYSATPQGTSFSARSFADLNLSRPLVKACQALGYAHPTPIQAACIPLALTGRDICGSAVTGSGKTAAFSLPLLERLLHRDRRVAATYVLVLTPTRELAVQVHSMMSRLGQFTDVRCALVVGGLSLNAQASELKSYPEIVVATPGRMIDHLRNTQNVGLEDLQALILDEADRLLEMGFAEEIREVVKMAPVKRQTMLFSATMTEEVRQLISLSLKHPVRLAADPTAAAPKDLTQEIVRLKGAQAAQKEAILLSLCSRSFAEGRCIVFFQTKHKAHRLKILFGLAGLPPAAELHGDMTQAARLESLERFRKGEVGFLLATDVAARGLDILGVETVINFDCPTQLASYLHRVGRTARAGAKGRAITLVEDGDRGLLKEVIRKTKVQMQQRQVPSQAVAAWQDRVERLEDAVAAVRAEEREEQALRKAEMEAQKALNLMEHEAEIYSRPARTWFQSEKQKKEVAVKAKEAEEEKRVGKRAKADAKAARRELLKKEKLAKQAEEKRTKNPLMEETASQKRTIKSIKAREAELRQQGVSAAKAIKIAAGMVTGVKSKKQKKKRAGGSGGQEGDGVGGLFSGDGITKPAPNAGPSRVYAGGARSGKLQVPRPVGALSKVELARAKRGGKGKHGFKSKAKHRRR